MSRILQEIFSQILEMSMIAGYCILAVLILRWLLRKAPKKYAYLLWLVVAFRLVCPTTVDSAFSIFNLNLLPESMQTESDRSEELPGIDPEVDGELSGQPDMDFEAGGELSGQLEMDFEAGGELSGQPEMDFEAGGALNGQLGIDLEVGGELSGQPGDSVQTEMPELTPDIGPDVNVTPGVDENGESAPGAIGGSNGLPEMQLGIAETPDEVNIFEKIKKQLSQLDWLEIGTWIWLGGVIVLTMVMLVSWIRLKRGVRTAVKIEEGVFETDKIDSAFVLGLVKPKIYLPVELNPQEKAWVLLHEHCHVYRNDHLVKSLATALTVVYWFNPLVWVAWFSMCRDMEMSCDEMALEGASAEMRKEYSRTLLAVAANKRINWNAVTAFGEVSVKNRIKHVLSFKKPAVWMGALFAAVMVVVLVVFGTDGQADEPDNPSTEDSTGVTEGENPGADESGDRESTEEESTEADEEKKPRPTVTTNWLSAEAEADWMSAVWETFGTQTELDWSQTGAGDYLGGQPTKYTGFMDIHPWVLDFEYGADYDNDGLTDRVFQRYLAETDEHEVYLFFGSGNVLKLIGDAGNDYRVESADLTGDGQKEILFYNSIHYDFGNAEDSGVTIFRKIDGQWMRAENQSLFWAQPSGAQYVVLDLLVERIDRKTLEITQPDCGVSIRYELRNDALDSTDYYYYVPEIGETRECEVWAQSSNYFTTESGEPRILCVGGSEHATAVWEMSCPDGQWRVEDFTLVGFQLPGQAEYYLDIERTEANLTAHDSLEEVIGTTGQRGQIILKKNGLVSMRFDGDSFFYKGWASEISKFCSATVNTDLNHLAARPETPEQIRIDWKKEDGTFYLITEYNGEKLYWELEERDGDEENIPYTFISFDQESSSWLCRPDGCTEKADGYYISGQFFWELVFPADERLGQVTHFHYEEGDYRVKDTKVENVFLPYKNVFEEETGSRYGYIRLQKELVDGEWTGNMEFVSVMTGERILLEMINRTEMKVSEDDVAVMADGTVIALLEYLKNGGDPEAIQGAIVRSGE